MRATWIALSLLLPSFAAAQEAEVPAEVPVPPAEPSEAEREASLRDQAGEIALHHGSFDTALSDFERALELAPTPDRMFARARALDALRRESDLVDAYRAFLATAPDDPRAAEVRARLAVLEARAVLPAEEEETPVTREAPVQATQTDADLPFYEQPWFWVGAGIIVVAVVIALVLGAVDAGVEEPIAGDDGVIVRTLTERM